MSSRVHITGRWHVVMRGVVVLALLALAVGLAQPICDALASHADIGASLSHSDDSGACCASADEGQLVASADEVLPSFEARLPLLPGVTGGPALRPRASLPASLLLPDRPAISRPYHARSARILL